MSRSTGDGWRVPGRAARSTVLICVWLAAGCAEEVRSGESEPSVSETRPTIALAEPERSSSRRSFQTHLYSERDADLYNRLMIEETAGGGIPITAIHVELGDRVKAQQLLATLENSDARLYVEAAQPEAEFAAANLRRIEELKVSGAVSQAEYDQAVFQSRIAEAAIEQAKLHLSRTEIRAPFSGVVSRRYVRVGDIVGNETPLFRVTAMAPLRARLLVPEAEVAAFGAGAPVAVTAPDGTTGTGRVILVSPTIDPGSGTREVVVELAETNGFRPGASVTAELVDQQESDQQKFDQQNPAEKPLPTELQQTPPAEEGAGS